MGSQTREEVMAAIVAVAREAEAAGGDGLAAISAAFPGVPGMILGEAWTIAQDDVAEAWWRTVEKTIDGEVIRKAIASAAPATTEGGPR